MGVIYVLCCTHPTSWVCVRDTQDKWVSISNAQSTIGMIVGYCPPTRMERRTFHDACEECYFFDDLVKVGANDV
jgi:hypothetical protein